MFVSQETAMNKKISYRWQTAQRV